MLKIADNSIAGWHYLQKESVCLKKLGIKTQDKKTVKYDNAVNKSMKVWQPDLDSCRWHRTVKDLLDRDEIDRGLVDEFYSKRGLEWKD